MYISCWKAFRPLISPIFDRSLFCISSNPFASFIEETDACVSFCIRVSGAAAASGERWRSRPVPPRRENGRRCVQGIHSDAAIRR